MGISEDKEIDIFVGSKIGSFKHVKYHTDETKYSKKCIENLVDIKSLQKDDGITCMEWGNSEQTEILLGRKNQQIQIYDTLQGFTKTYTADFDTGDLVGLGRFKRKLIAALSSGVVRVWSKKVEESVNTGGKLDTMRVCADDQTIFATGGEENDLKLWRIGETSPTFVAKNLPQDFLQLRQPVWVSGLAFLPREGGRLVAVCSRHGYVRLYDSRAQRRPVCNVMFPNMAATCMATSFGDKQVLVGFGRGHLHQVDLRRGRPDKGYQGAAGAVTSVAAAPARGLVFSASLDRWLRAHAHETKGLLQKQYLTSKPTCLLVQTETSTPLRCGSDDVKEENEEQETPEVEPCDDMDQLFESMETVGEKRKNKNVVTLEETSNKMRPSAEGATDCSQVAEDSPDDAIVQLLRSTERHKRRMERRRREKKAKSVFHNA